MEEEKKILLTDFIKTIEAELNKTARKNHLPRQPGDVFQTYSSCQKLYNDYGYKPYTNIKDGVSKFINWYKNFCEVI